MLKAGAGRCRFALFLRERGERHAYGRSGPEKLAACQGHALEGIRCQVSGVRFQEVSGFPDTSCETYFVVTMLVARTAGCLGGAGL